MILVVCLLGIEAVWVKDEEGQELIEAKRKTIKIIKQRLKLVMENILKRAVWQEEQGEEEEGIIIAVSVARQHQLPRNKNKSSKYVVKRSK